MSYLNLALDLTFDPAPETEGRTLLPAASLRVYESSLPGLVSVFMPGDMHSMGRGIRLNRSQVETLSAALTAYLSEETRNG